MLKAHITRSSGAHGQWKLIFWVLLMRLQGCSVLEGPIWSSGPQKENHNSSWGMEGQAASVNDSQLRTYIRAGNDGPREVIFSSLLKPGKEHVPILRGSRTVEASALKRVMDTAAVERVERLNSLWAVKPSAPPLPNDGSLRITTINMSIADVRTLGSLGGSRQGRELDVRQLSFINQLATIGQLEGFQVVVRVDKDQVKALAALENLRIVSVIQYEGPDDIWTEDTGDIRADHSISVPASARDRLLIVSSVLRDRVKRFSNSSSSPKVDLDMLQRLLLEHYPDASFESLGRVNQLDSQRSFAVLGVINGAKIRQELAYLEGGNQLIGALPDGEDYVIIGKDSVAASKAVLERDLGEPLTEKQVLRVIASDLGIKPAHIYPIEQPGEFHLDMSLMLIGSKEVVLNDAEEASHLQEQWLREDYAKLDETHEAADREQLESFVRDIREHARVRALAEDKTLVDLKAAGFTVHRMAGVFHDWRKRMNVMNTILGTNLEGQRYAVVFGADPRAEKYVAQKLLNEIPTGLDRIHFLSHQYSMPSGSGGIKCRSKPEGDVVIRVASPTLAIRVRQPGDQTAARH